LDPAVTLRALQPGPWDCQNRDQLMSLLRLRAEQRGDKPSPEIHTQCVDESTFLVSGLGGSEAVATLVKLAKGRVISMQRSRPTRSRGSVRNTVGLCGQAPGHVDVPLVRTMRAGDIGCRIVYGASRSRSPTGES
jgi:hypothetical protein